MGHGRAGQAVAWHGRAWHGMVGHDMALQGMQGMAHMAGSYHSYESSLHDEGCQNLCLVKSDTVSGREISRF